MADLINFIIGTCKIWQKIDLGHETETLAFQDRGETETLTIFVETRSRRDIDTSRDRDVETETTTVALTLLNPSIRASS